MGICGTSFSGITLKKQTGDLVVERGIDGYTTNWHCYRHAPHYAGAAGCDWRKSLAGVDVDAEGVITAIRDLRGQTFLRANLI